MIGSVKKSIKRTVSYTDDSIVQSTPKRPRCRNLFKATKRRSIATGELERQPSISSMASELSEINPLDMSSQSITSIKSTTSTKSSLRRKSFGEKITATKKKIISRFEKSKLTKKTITEHPNRVFSTQLILANNQHLVEDLVIWEEQYST